MTYLKSILHFSADHHRGRLPQFAVNGMIVYLGTVYLNYRNPIDFHLSLCIL
jgi:hypothetical protein